MARILHSFQSWIWRVDDGTQVTQAVQLMKDLYDADVKTSILSAPCRRGAELFSLGFGDSYEARCVSHDGLVLVLPKQGKKEEKTCR